MRYLMKQQVKQQVEQQVNQRVNQRVERPIRRQALGLGQRGQSMGLGMSRLLSLWMASVILLSGFSGVSVAQDRKTVSPPERLLADQLVLQARLSVEGQPNVSPDLLTRSRILLELASEVYGEDPETWVLLRDLAVAMEDDEAALRALERYLELAPEDDVARLNWILGKAERDGQTVERQVVLIAEELDGSGSENLSAALRSRLASQIAELSWDSGDMTTFGRRLSQALRLDPETNNQAAQLLLNLAMSREGARPEQVGQAMMGVVRTDPLNPELRQSLADLLMGQAAYPVAAQQYNTAGRLATRRLDDVMMHNWVISLSAVGATDTALRLLRDYEELLIRREQTQRMLRDEGDPRLQGTEGASDDEIDRALEELMDEGDPAAQGQATPPVITENQLPIQLEVIRLAIYQQTRDRILADESFGWLQRKIGAHVKEGNTEATEVAAWLSLLFNRDIDKAATLIAQIEGSAQGTGGAGDTGGHASPMLRRLRAWLDLRQGRTAQAKAAFESQLESDPYAGLGLSLTMEANADRAAVLQRVIHRDPAGVGGLLASFAMRNQGVAFRPTNAGEALTDAMARWPAVIESPNLQAKRWTKLRVETPQREYRYLDPVHATISMENSSGVALGVSHRGPLPATLRMFLTPRQGGQAMGTTPATVMWMNRRLRLEAREKITLDVDLTATRLGMFLFGMPNRRLSFDMRTVLDPTHEPVRGMVVATPVGDEVVLRAIQRQPVPATDQAITIWLNALNEPNRETLFRALGQLAQLAPLLTSVEDNEETVDLGLKITQALEEKFPELDPDAQAWTIAFISRTRDGAPGIPTILEMARRSDEPLVRIAYLLTWIIPLPDAPDSPDLTAAMRHENPTIAAFARAHRAVIIQQLAAQAAAEAR